MGGGTAAPEGAVGAIRAIGLVALSPVQRRQEQLWSDMSAGLEGLLSLYEANFRYTVQDVKTLLRLHDTETERKRGRPPVTIEVLKRSALILTVTAWEAFIEDAIRVTFEQRLAAATSPHDVEGTFCAVAAGWLNPGANSRPKPADLLRWTGEGWKELLNERFAEEIKNLNTPNSENIRGLSKRYIGSDLTASWRWGRVITSSSSCARLDKLIRRRGELVHRGKELFEKGGGAKRKEADEALSLVTRLVECSSSALAQAV